MRHFSKLLLALTLFLVGAAQAGAQSLGDTDDVLDGARYLVRADDLVLVDPYAFPDNSAPTATQVSYFSLATEDGVITSGEEITATAVVRPPCQANPANSTPFPQSTQVMRMFDLPYDVTVVLAPSAATSGAGCSNGQPNNMTFYVYDPMTGEHYSTAVGNAGMTNGWLHTAVADFNADGLDDLFVLSSQWAYVVSAHTPSDPSAGVVIRTSFNFSQTPMADPTIADFNDDGNLDVAWMGASFTAGAVPAVHLATICTGPIEGTVCAGAASFTIRTSTATIAPKALTGSIVAVGGHCLQNDNNQESNELRAPAMAVAAGQYDGAPGSELLVVSLYEDSNKNCKAVAEVYSFATFTGSAGQNLVPTLESTLDDLGPHSHIASPSSIYAAAGRIDWSADTDTAAVAISGGTEHNVLAISFTDGLLMTKRDHTFDSGNVNKSFAGLAIGRFASAPEADASTSCDQDSECTDRCASSTCEISGADCTADGDCTGVCSDGVCSYIKPNDYDLQIAAFLMARNSDDHFSEIFIYSADPLRAFEPEQMQNFNVEEFQNLSMDRAVRGGSLLRAGDLQGRSQRLGTPSVVRIHSNIQPDMVVAVPPMHADWLPFGDVNETSFCDPTPNNCALHFSSSNICNCTDLQSNSTCADGRELRCLFNFSTLAGEYTSRYEFDDSQTNQSETTETTSWSLGASVDISGKVKSVDEGVETTQELKFASENTYDHSVSKTNSSFQTHSFNAAVSTGFFDHVWYTVRDYNVFYYPVIGQTVCVDECGDGGLCTISNAACEVDADCPAAPDECDAADRQQLYVQYSGASSVVSTSADGGVLEWYQPVHEPGQILSYPWDCQELAARNEVAICPEDEGSADYSLLSDAASFSTDTTDQEYTLTWKGGNEQSKTVDKGADFSQKLTYTATASTPAYEESEEGLKSKYSISVNANEAVSTGRTNSSSFDASTGITVKRPGTFLNPGKFEYLVDGFIFGDPPTPNAYQEFPSGEGEVQAHGVLRSGFTVDPRALGGGAWWQSGVYNQYIDVALNRPVHLKPDPGVGVSQPGLTNCLPVSDDNISTADCVDNYLPDPTPHGLFSSQFYWLRGFFITPEGEEGQGPQLQQANAGDVLSLQARVYNYSLQDMNVGAIKVDFYAQEWDPQCNTPAGYYDHDQNCTQPGGGVVPCQNSCDPCCVANQPVDSIYIGQDVLGPLPAFNSTAHSGEANWTVATTTFDTGSTAICGNRGCGDKDFLFWVVVWPELSDNQGEPALRAELPDHSLTAIPGRLTSIADVCTKSNDCVNGTCRATGDACQADRDCPGEEDNVCTAGGSCAISGTTCEADEDCGECLCAVCMDEFSNNVGFYHKAFAINAELTVEPLSATADTAGAATSGALAGRLQVEHVTVAPAELQPGEQAIVRAGLRAVDARVDGQEIRFYSLPPDSPDLTPEEVFAQSRPFEVEVLARIRADRVHEAQAPFSSRQPGSHMILVSAFIGGEEQLLGTAEVEVGEGPQPTPTAVGDSDDDGCAVASPTRTSHAAIALLIAPLLFVARRRHRRGAGRSSSI